MRIVKFSTENNVFVAFWLAHSISVISSYTLVWPYIENDYAKCCQAKNFSPSSKISLGQNGGKISRFQELSTEEVHEMLENTIPAATKKAKIFGFKLFNDSYFRTFLIILSYVEILNSGLCNIINNNNNKSLPLKFSEWLASPFGSEFWKPWEEMSKEELNVCLKSFYTSARKKDYNFYEIYKSRNWPLSPLATTKKSL